MGGGSNKKAEVGGRIGQIMPSSFMASGNKDDNLNTSGEINLTSQENKIFNTLKKVANDNGVTVRVAGGWVRDKLLGRENKDIDISLDKMTGAQFAELVNKELHGNADDVSIIKANPDQSKHLETATMNIEDLPIDMVNLRTESYSDNSRIPEVKMGTAEEDASRRDLTINSLFYNLNTGEIEDHTGHGVEDLKEGVIRTPLEAKQTFTDDPLRALRAIRFAARYGFKIAPETLEGMSDKEVHKALKEKISAERVLKELKESLVKDPVLTIKTLVETGLSDAIMPELSALDMDQKSKYHDKTVLGHTIGLLEHVHKTDPDNLPLKWAALLHDVGKPNAAKPNPKTPKPTICYKDWMPTFLSSIKYQERI
jgi:tRNA nucleotidyltransferase/poly(A) polymerase